MYLLLIMKPGPNHHPSLLYKNHEKNHILSPIFKKNSELQFNTLQFRSLIPLI